MHSIILRIPEHVVLQISRALVNGGWLTESELKLYFGDLYTLQFLAQFEDFLVIGEVKETSEACYALGESEIEAYMNQKELLAYYHRLWDV